MKRALFLTTFAILVTLLCQAQSQAGYVKTPGRMGADGKVIAGQRIPAATLYFRGVSAVVSGGDGSFTVAVPGKSFVLTRIQKNGYEPIDHDIIGKSHTRSSEPFIVVMDKPERILAETLASERRLRRTMQKQLRAREDEIEALKEQQRITDEEYRKKLQELYASQESNEKLISGMAERYARMDFDQIDDFHRRVALFIQNGELTRADSLLNTKGRMEDRAAELKDMERAIRANADDLAQRRDTYEKGMAMRGKDLEYFGADCYNRSEICLKNNDIDSAAYYMELRADADTLNARWQNDAGVFAATHLHDYAKALRYHERALKIRLQQSGDSHPDVAESYNHIGETQASLGEYAAALDSYRKALAVLQTLYGNNDARATAEYDRIADLYTLAKSHGVNLPECNAPDIEPNL